jgi:EAL domain-containing protein (putative c-di-GMP-specific phosphodiesterase class I)
MALAKKLLQLTLTPFKVEDHHIEIKLKMGICNNKDHDYSAQEMFRHTAMALHHSKNSSIENITVFNQQLHQSQLRVHQIERLLANAIGKNELELYLQPQVNIKTGDLYGAEALLRWSSAELGRVSPGEFIPIAERSGLIFKIGSWVIEQGAQIVSRLDQHKKTDLKVAINVSAAQFTYENVEQLIISAIEKYNIRPAQFEVEITENLLLEQDESIQQSLATIQDYGVDIAIDDFGTGYSNMSYLGKLPVNVLKIDQAFIFDLDNQSNKAIVKTMINLADNLKLKSLAEGVETKEHLQMLEEMGCDIAQGYYFSKPIPVDDFIKEYLE